MGYYSDTTSRERHPAHINKLETCFSWQECYSISPSTVHEKNEANYARSSLRCFTRFCKKKEKQAGNTRTLFDENPRFQSFLSRELLMNHSINRVPRDHHGIRRSHTSPIYGSRTCRTLGSQPYGDGWTVFFRNEWLHQGKVNTSSRHGPSGELHARYTVYVVCLLKFWSCFLGYYKG